MTSTNPPTPTMPSASRRGLARFRRDQDGATVVEFAVVAFPFFAMMGAILEMGMMFFTTQVLEEATFQTSRSLLTGRSYEIYNSTPTINTERFRRDICSRAPVLVPCDRLAIDVRAYNSFDLARTGTLGSNPVAGAGNVLNTSGFGFTQPQPKQIVVVRAVLDYQLYTPNISNALVNVGGGRRAIIATTTFRAEPFNPPTS